MKHTSLPCLCASFRRASRALTQLYDADLRPTGLRVTQFTVLQALSLAGEISQKQLGALLAMDSTTLTRTLGLLVKEGWIAERRGADRRERQLRLSPAGRRRLDRATPVWQGVQRRLASRFGTRRWQELFNVATELLDGAASLER
jgi:DNA-binding MarR family transcriptional regulator